MKPATPALARYAALALGAVLAVGLMATGITKEVPRGGVSGVVRMAENGKPLPNATVYLRPKVTLTEEQLAEMRPDERPRSHVTETDDEGRYELRFIPAGDYEMEASGEAHRIEPVAVTVIEGKPLTQDVVLKPDDPYLNLYANENVFLPKEEIKFPLHGFIKTSSLSVDAFRLDPRNAAQAGSLANTLRRMAESSRQAKDLVGATQVLSEERPIRGRDIEGIFRENLKLSALPEGLYFVRVSADGLRAHTYINVTRLALVTKQAGPNVLAFVTDLKSGKPQPGARVVSYANGSLRELGRTDRNGLLRARLADAASGAQQTLIAEAGASRAYVDLWRDNPGDTTCIVTYTDRPIYRPGDTVQYKGIVRSFDGTNYQRPESGTVTIEVRDEDESLIDRTTKTLSPMGTYFGEFSLNSEAPPGNYTIRTIYGRQTEFKSVTIAAYRKPEFSIKVTPERPSYVSGERARAVVQVDYYFGAPVAGAEVSASLLRSPTWDYLDPDEDAEEYASESGYGGEYIDEIKATTDESGKAVIEFDTKYDDAWLNDADTEIVLNVSVSEGDKYFDGTGSVKVRRGAFALEASTGRYVSDINQPVEVELHAFEHDGKQARSGVPLAIVAGYEVWTGNESVFRPLENLQAVTGADGKAKVTVTPNRSGSFVIRASADDGKGNQVRAVEYVYIYGGAALEEGPPSAKLEVVLDKRRYRVGEQATALIRTNRPGGTALVTVEASGILSARTVALTGSATQLRLPVTADMRPNVLVNVSYVHEKAFNSAQRRLSVDLGARKLQVQIEPDQATYQPGAQAVYTVRTLDDQGRPVPAEVSLGVVDEAIYAIYDDRFDIVKTLYPVRYSQVRTSYSFETIYLDGGDKAPSDIQIRRDFRDTAFWAPSVMTDASGTARVEVKLPDNLTRWRATAIALTADTAVGQAVNRVRARKDLMVRLQAPVFLTQRDERRLMAMVTNDTGKDADVRVELTTELAKLNGDLTRQVTVPAGGTRPITWELLAPETGTASFVAKAWIDGGASDGVELKVPVRPHGRTTLAWAAGSVVDAAEFKVNVLENADRNTGRLRLVISPTLASGIVQSLDELIDFPYGCVEQTLSRFVPTVAVSQTLKVAGLPPLRRADQIPQMVAEGQTRLKRMQHSDGGWGWWEHDQSDLGMTAMVLEGLYEAQRAGFTPNAFMVERGAKWLAENAVKPELEPKAPTTDREWDARPAFRSKLAHCAYALALSGKPDVARQIIRRLPREQLRPVDWANLALTYHAAGETVARDRALSVLRALAKETELGATWEESHWGMETSGRALFALARLSPESDLIPKVVRALMAKRRGGIWFSTRDTATIVLALNEIWRRESTFDLGGEVVVTVNGEELRRLPLTTQSFLAPDLVLDVAMDKLRSGENTIALSKTGGGTLYYSAELRQTGVEDQIAAATTTSGFEVGRRYLKMTAQRMEDGRLRTLPSKEQVRDFRRGDIVRVEITLRSDAPRDFLMIEDPIPSGFRVTERENVGLYEEWSYWWSKLVVRDDRVAFFVTYLPKGESKISYTLQAETPGSARVLPGEAYNMYDPDARASSAGEILRVAE